MEMGFFAENILNTENQNTNWINDLRLVLKNPDYVYPFFKSWIIRYRRYYIWITDFIIFCWLYKLILLKIFPYWAFVLLFFFVFQHLIFFIYKISEPDF